MRDSEKEKHCHHRGSISEYIWGFCVDSIKSNAKIKKEERSGKVGTVEKADLKSI